MLIPNQTVETSWNPFTKKHYESKGYEYTKIGDKLKVKVEDLPKNSHMKVRIICDYCGKEYKKIYKDYFVQHEQGDCCNDCKQVKAEKVLKEKYGENREEIIKNTQNTLTIKYGVNNAAKIPGSVDKAKQTNLKRYGVETVLILPENRQKMKEVSFTPEALEKRKQTCLEKYGVKYAAAAPEIIEKRMDTLSKNGKVRTSKQQLELFDILSNMYNICKLNYRVWYYSLDCMVETEGVKIDVEYDGRYWHSLNKQRDEKRNEYILNKGYKILRIISEYSIPSKEQLKEWIDKLVLTEDKILICDIGK